MAQYNPKRAIPIIVALVLLSPLGALAQNQDRGEVTDKRITMIWNACDRRFGPVPDPKALKSWTVADKQRAMNVFHCIGRLLSSKMTEL
jgi:hypothetical protein